LSTTFIAKTHEALERKENGHDLPVATVPDPEHVNMEANMRSFRGFNIGGDVVTKATAGLPEDQRIVIRWLYDRHRTLGWSQDRTEKEVGVSKSLLFRIFKGEYTYSETIKEKRVENGVVKIVNVPNPKAGQAIPLDNVCAKIAKAKRDAEKTQALFSVGFLATSVWERISWACEQALIKNRIVFIYGDGQIGKTTCLMEFARLHNGGQTTFVRIPPCGGVQSLLRFIAKALHVSSKKSFHALLEDVLNALDKSKLLIFDEIHEIFIAYNKSSAIKCMELLRYIHDQTHCGMVLSGTDIFRDAFDEGDFFRFLQQLHRRGLRQIALPDVAPKKDLVLALKSYGLDWPDDRKVEDELYHLAHEGFGQFLTRVDDGKKHADKREETYTWDNFITARNINRRMSLKPMPENRQVRA
jgi:DNA transposition AAA+ family ATPase/AraC-like DNA-binding protein